MMKSEALKQPPKGVLTTPSSKVVRPLGAKSKINNKSQEHKKWPSTRSYESKN